MDEGSSTGDFLQVAMTSLSYLFTIVSNAGGAGLS